MLQPKSDHMESGRPSRLSATQSPQCLAWELEVKLEGELNSKEGRREATWGRTVVLPLPPQQNVLPAQPPGRPSDTTQRLVLKLTSHLPSSPRPDILLDLCNDMLPLKHRVRPSPVCQTKKVLDQASFHKDMHR